MENCFVEAGVTRYELSNGHWVEFKNELTYGEELALEQGVLQRAYLQEVIRSGGKMGEEDMPIKFDVDVRAVVILRLFTWITDWSLTGADGKYVAISKSAIINLKRVVAEELRLLLDNHEAALEKNALKPGSD